MVKREQNIGSRRSSGGSGAGGGGGVSSQWVEEHYISKEFFARLFTINGTDGNNQDVVVEPNDPDTTIKNIQIMVGAWTEQYLSALGQGSGGGGGGGGVTLNTLLNSMNQATLNPSSVTNKVLVNSNGAWSWKDYNSGGGSGGTVTSIKITVPTGFQVSPTTPITSSGTFSIDFATGYALPTTAKQAEWDTAYTWVNTNGASTVSKTAWGQIYWNAGAPQTISGDIKSATSLEFSGVKNGSNHGGYIDFHYNGGGSDYTSRIIEDQIGILKINNTIWATLSGNVGVGNNSPSYKLDVTGVIHVTTGLLSNGYVTALSDIRYKNVVAKVSPDVEDIAGASIIRYAWKNREDKSIHIGGIAQEWQKILPETVIESEGRLSMDYGVIGTIAAITTARKVVDHEKRIRQLENENQRLVAEINELKRH